MRSFRLATMVLLVTVGAACQTKVETVEVAPAKVSFDTDIATKTLTVVIKDADGAILEEPRPMTFSSRDPGIAKVDTAGVVKPIGTGKTVITVTVEEKTTTATVEVVLLKRIQLQTLALVLQAGTAGEPLRLDYMNERGEVLDVDLAKRPTWKSAWTTGDTAVATVTDAGVVTGVAAGTTTLVASVGDLKAEMKLTINPAPEPEPAPAPVPEPDPVKTKKKK